MNPGNEVSVAVGRDCWETGRDGLEMEGVRISLGQRCFGNMFKLPILEVKSEENIFLFCI